MEFWILFIVLALVINSDINCYYKPDKKEKIEKLEFRIEDLKLNCIQILQRVDKMTGQQFEEFFVFLLNKLGHHAYVTRTTGDFGADSVIIINNLKIVAQAKRYSKRVGGDAVREVLGAIKPYHADRGIVITNNYFTKKARELAECNNIELWDRATLIELIEQAQSKLNFR